MELKLKICIIIEKDGDILLIKEKPGIGSKHGWNVCGGGWDESDKDILNTAIREAKEESGLEVVLRGMYKIAFVNLITKHRLQFFFVGEATSKNVVLPTKEEQEKLDEDIIEYRWASKEEILTMPENEFISSTTAKILKEYAEAPTNFPLCHIAYFDSETKL